MLVKLAVQLFFLSAVFLAVTMHQRKDLFLDIAVHKSSNNSAPKIDKNIEIAYSEATVELILKDLEGEIVQCRQELDHRTNQQTCNSAELEGSFLKTLELSQSTLHVSTKSPLITDNYMTITILSSFL